MDLSARCRRSWKSDDFSKAKNDEIALSCRIPRFAPPDHNMGQILDFPQKPRFPHSERFVPERAPNKVSVATRAKVLVPTVPSFRNIIEWDLSERCKRSRKSDDFSKVKNDEIALSCRIPHFAPTGHNMGQILDFPQ